jgi:hypothetical protein
MPVFPELKSPEISFLDIQKPKWHNLPGYRVSHRAPSPGKAEKNPYPEISTLLGSRYQSAPSFFLLRLSFV